MVTRVHKYKEDRYSPEGDVLEIKGKEELSIAVSLHGHRYEDWISINSYEGNILLKGCHVGDLVDTILRFSSKSMRKYYKELLDLIDLSHDDEIYRPKPFHAYDVEEEKLRRKHIIEWSEKRDKTINKYLLGMLQEK